jgi:hypothetical protein
MKCLNQDGRCVAETDAGYLQSEVRMFHAKVSIPSTTDDVHTESCLKKHSGQ